LPAKGRGKPIWSFIDDPLRLVHGARQGSGGHDFVQIEPAALTLLAREAMRDIAHLLRPGHLAPTYSEAQVVKPHRFNAYYDIEDVKPLLDRLTELTDEDERVLDMAPGITDRKL
jgi:hypothetical protein